MKPILHPRTNQQIEGLLRQPKGAYLFVGKDGMGRRTTSIWLAKQLHCGQQPHCATCHLIELGNYGDLVVVEPEDNSIGIGQTQQTLAKLNRSRISSSGTRMLVIDQAELLTPEAQNSLLKTMEEPPEKTIIVLLVNDQSRLLPTIRSRCEVVYFASLPSKTIEQHLSALNLPAERVSRATELSQGAIGLAIALGTDSELFERYTALYELITQIPAQSAFERLLTAAKLQEKSYQPQMLSSLLARHLRQRLRLAKSEDLDRITHSLSALERFEQYRRSNVNGRATWSRLLLEL